MILWTIQPVEVIDILNEKGVFTCEAGKSEFHTDFYDAYMWMVDKMDERNIYHPHNLKFPIWAWHTRNFKHRKPDFRTIGLGKANTTYACIEFEISDEQVLLSDFIEWHCVLNNDFLNFSNNEFEFDMLDDMYNSLPNQDIKEIFKKRSWETIFDIKKYQSTWKTKGEYIQAVFWELKKDMIKNIKYFNAR